MKVLQWLYYHLRSRFWRRVFLILLPPVKNGR